MVPRSVSGPRQRRMTALKAQIKACQRCPGLNIPRETESAPGYGSVDSPVVIVGQSLCHQCMDTQIPFTGGSGRFIDEALKDARIAKDQIFITNVVHCHPHDYPRDNRPSHPHEIENCTSYLHSELDIVEPQLIIGLGQDARNVLRSRYPENEPLPWPFKVPRASGAGTPRLLLPPHPYWIMTRPKDIREQYVASLASALKWSFAKGSLRSQPVPNLEPTCDGMVPAPIEPQLRPDHFAVERDS
jgi:uracil-DNA glycosylase family 4